MTKEKPELLSEISAPIMMLRTVSDDGTWQSIVVCDAMCAKLRVSFGTCVGVEPLSLHPGEFISVGVAAEWDAEKPGQLANFDYNPEHDSRYFGTGDISITADGVLVALQKKRAPHIQISETFQVKLPEEFIEPVRKALQLTVDAATAAFEARQRADRQS